MSIVIEILMVLAVAGYIYYLRNYADLRTRSEKEEASLQEGIRLFKTNQIQAAFAYFDQRIKSRPNSAISYLYRGLCYKETGNIEAAMNDLNTGLTFDQSVFGLHLEKGKILFGKEMYDAALQSLDKAIFNAGDLDPESYYWRGLTKEHLHRSEDARKDFDKEALIIEEKKRANLDNQPEKQPFLDRRLLANSVLILFTSAFLVVVIKKAESIHLPYLLATVSAISIGFVEPRKGWVLAIMQCILILSGYFLFTTLPGNGGRIELENFSLYGSAGLTFAGSFLGAFLKRAINQG